MFVAPLTVLGDSLPDFSIVQVAELVKAEIQRSDSQVTSALPDFTGKPRICVIEGGIAKGKVASAGAPLSGPQSNGSICEAKNEQNRTPGDVHR